MTNITINTKNNTLVITKNFEKAASRFGTPEYKELKEARADFPNFKVVVRTVKQKKETYKGLTYEYMEKYIEKHDENGTIMEEYKMLRGKSDDGMEALAVSCSYAEMKEWFFATFPAVVEFHKKREAVLNRVNVKKAA